MRYDTQRCERELAIKGWTQSTLAEKSGLSNAVISNFLNGKPVRNDNAKTIVTKLGLRMEDVLVEDSEKEAV